MAESKSASLPLADAPTRERIQLAFSCQHRRRLSRSQGLDADLYGKYGTTLLRVRLLRLLCSAGGLAGSLDFGEVSVEDPLFHDRARALIQRVRDVFEGTVFAALARHGYKQARGTADDLQI